MLRSFNEFRFMNYEWREHCFMQPCQGSQTIPAMPLSEGTLATTASE